MSAYAARCSKCGDILELYLTDSGSYLIVEPCEKQCSTSEPDKFTSDEDFE